MLQTMGAYIKKPLIKQNSAVDPYQYQIQIGFPGREVIKKRGNNSIKTDEDPELSRSRATSSGCV